MKMPDEMNPGGMSAPTEQLDGSPLPPTAPKGMAIMVPVSSLAMPGEDEKMNNPAMGDMVTFHVEGKVSAIQGEQATVTIETINGKPVTAQAAQTNDTPDEDAEYAQLQSMARAQDDAGSQGGMP